MRILVVGGGGREHSLAWKIKQSPKCEALFIAPGNTGTEALGENVAIDIKNNQAVVALAKEKKIDLVVVGPDDQIAQGMVDSLESEGIKTFGPSRAAAKLEWSKVYAKEFMARHAIPTARSQTFYSFDEAFRYVQEEMQPFVIKADGLALGKGVVIAMTKGEAEDALRRFMEKSEFGYAGKTVIIEEYLAGSEISIHAFCDGKTAKIFPISRDHKRIFNGNHGPNTGGMGANAPISAPSFLTADIERTIVDHVLHGMHESGIPYKGVLYPGVMVTKKGLRVLEFNARFGDPECESYMRLLESDLVEIMLACIEGRLDKEEIHWSNKFVVTVVLASRGYPARAQAGFLISGLDTVFDDSIVVFHAGTKKTENGIITAGGRVLMVSAVGDTAEDAKSRAYSAAEKINFEGKQYRTDVGSVWTI